MSDFFLLAFLSRNKAAITIATPTTHSVIAMTLTIVALDVVLFVAVVAAIVVAVVVVTIAAS